MMNEQEKKELLRQLQASEDIELSNEDLERMLDDELAKPESEMNEDLVHAILETLGDDAQGDAVSAEAQRRAWRKVARKLPRNPWRTALGWAGKAAAIIAITAGLLFATYETARAFDWQVILRLMRPLTDMFTLYSGEIQEDHVAQLQTTNEESTEIRKGELMKDGKKQSTTQIIKAYADIPDQLLGYPVKPRGIPARFSYVQGSVYTDELMTVAAHFFTSEHGMVIFKVRLIEMNADSPTVFHFEKTMDETKETYISHMRVTYYFNADDMTLSASWNDEYAQYSLFGELNEEEMAAVIEATMMKN